MNNSEIFEYSDNELEKEMKRRHDINKTNLKLCPCCKGESIRTDDGDDDQRIDCTGPKNNPNGEAKSFLTGCGLSTWGHKSMSAAVNAWNKRPE